MRVPVVTRSRTPADDGLKRVQATAVSIFPTGSLRRQISVLWMLARPNHKETLRMSQVASGIWKAQRQRRMCGNN